MKKRTISLGDKTYEGQTLARVIGAGDISVKESQVDKIYCAGDLDLVKSTVGKLRAAGDLAATQSHIQTAKIVGNASFQGGCEGDCISIVGKAQADVLTCRLLRCQSENRRVHVSGIAARSTWSGHFIAETFEICHPFRLSCDYDFKTIIAAADLISDGEIECEHFYGLAPLQAEAINAETVFILAEAQSRIKTLTGTTIKVSREFSPDKAFARRPAFEKYSKQKSDGELLSLDTIEGDTIDVDHTRAYQICGQNVHIGPMCVVDRVEYLESIDIDPKAIVSEVNQG